MNKTGREKGERVHEHRSERSAAYKTVDNLQMTEANERNAQEHATNIISEETQDVGNGKQQGNRRNPVEYAQSTDSEIRQVTSEEEFLSDGGQDTCREEREESERWTNAEKHAHANNE